MLALFYLFLGSLVSSHAAVVDRLSCQMHYQPSGDSRPVETQVDLNMPRRLVDNGSESGIIMYEAVAGASATAQGERYQAAFQLVSRYAVKLSSKGVPLKAAQHLCLSHTFLAGEKGLSADCRPACENPFDRKCKWTPVELRGALPVFDARLLKEVSQTLGQGSLKIGCRFDNTLE